MATFISAEKSRRGKESREEDFTLLAFIVKHRGIHWVFQN